MKTSAIDFKNNYGPWAVISGASDGTGRAFTQQIAAVGAREVGLFVSNAGSDPNGSHFLNKDIDAWRDLVNRNVVTNMECTHHFASLMRQRRKGGLLLVGSAAGYGGSRFMAVYSGSKASVWCLAESLWLELRPHNIDVLYIALVATDTPFLQRLLKEKGQKPMMASSPDDVARKGLANLSNGPVFDMLRLVGIRGAWRGGRARLISYLGKSVFGE